MIPVERRISDNTRLIDLTVGDLKELLKQWNDYASTVKPVRTERNLVYGIKGIRDLFHVSDSTARRLKDRVIMKAVYQVGRTIVVDADMALLLFKNYEKKSGR